MKRHLILALQWAAGIALAMAAIALTVLAVALIVGGAYPVEGVPLPRGGRSIAAGVVAAVLSLVAAAGAALFVGKAWEGRKRTMRRGLARRAR